MKQYLANSKDVNISTNLLNKIAHESESITVKEFLNECDLTDFNMFGMDTVEVLKNMLIYPYDFDFFEYHNIMGFSHSAVEFLFR